LLGPGRGYRRAMRYRAALLVLKQRDSQQPGIWCKR
jgi:hypothetical protein